MKTCAKCQCGFGTCRMEGERIIELPDESDATLCDGCDPAKQPTQEALAAADAWGQRVREAVETQKHAARCARKSPGELS